MVSESWDEGTGRFSNLPTSSNGSSWIYRDNSTTKTEWTTSSFIGNEAFNNLLNELGLSGNEEVIEKLYSAEFQMIGYRRYKT